MQKIDRRLYFRVQTSLRYEENNDICYKGIGLKNILSISSNQIHIKQVKQEKYLNKIYYLVV
jgi:hypothetical protein